MRAAREIVRGLGLMSGLYQRQTLNTGVNYVTPPIMIVQDPIHPKTNYTYFQPLTAFDNLLNAAGHPVLDLVNAINTKTMVNVSQNEFLRNYEENTKELNHKSLLLSAFTSTDLEITISPPLLATATAPSLNSPIDIELKMSSEPDEMLILGREGSAPGITLQSEMVKRSMHSILGPNILKFFEHLGYHTTLNRYDSKFHVIALFPKIITDKLAQMLVNSYDADIAANIRYDAFNVQQIAEAVPQIGQMVINQIGEPSHHSLSDVAIVSSDLPRNPHVISGQNRPRVVSYDELESATVKSDELSYHLPSGGIINTWDDIDWELDSIPDKLGSGDFISKKRPSKAKSAPTDTKRQKIDPQSDLDGDFWLFEGIEFDGNGDVVL